MRRFRLIAISLACLALVGCYTSEYGTRRWAWDRDGTPHQSMRTRENAPQTQTVTVKPIYTNPSAGSSVYRVE